MRKLVLVLPLIAIVMAAGVLVATLGTSFAATTPTTPEVTATAAPATDAAPAQGWQETAAKQKPSKKSGGQTP